MNELETKALLVGINYFIDDLKEIEPYDTLPVAFKYIGLQETLKVAQSAKSKLETQLK
jgi:hypothetical protein